MNVSGLALWDRTLDFATDVPLVQKRQIVQWRNKKSAFLNSIESVRPIGNFGWNKRKKDLLQSFVRNRPPELFHILDGTDFVTKRENFETAMRKEANDAVSIFELIKINTKIYLNLFQN